MGTWNNSDGLNVRFGLTTQKGAKVGSPRTAGNTKELVIKIVATELGTANTVLGGVPNHALPDNCFIESALLIVTTLFTGASAKLDLGLVKASDGTTEIDFDGIDVAIAVTDLDSVDKDVTCDGALIGTTITDPAVFIATESDSNEFTAGEAQLIIKYHLKPKLSA